MVWQKIPNPKANQPNKKRNHSEISCQTHQGSYYKNMCWWACGEIVTLVIEIKTISTMEGFPGGASGKEPTCQCRKWKRRGFDPWAQKIPWRRKRQPTLVFLPREFHGQRSLVGYSSWDHKESDMSEWLTFEKYSEYFSMDNWLVEDQLTPADTVSFTAKVIEFNVINLFIDLKNKQM